MPGSAFAEGYTPVAETKADDGLPVPSRLKCGAEEFGTEDEQPVRGPRLVVSTLPAGCGIMRVIAAAFLVSLLFTTAPQAQDPPVDIQARIDDLKKQIAEKKVELAKLEVELAKLDPSSGHKIQGKWRTIEVESAGAKLGRDAWVHLSFNFNGKDVVAVAQKAGEVPYTLLLDASQAPAQIDLVHKNPKLSLYGIYKFEGEKLVMCLREGGPRPRKFDSTEADGCWLMTLDAAK